MAQRSMAPGLRRRQLHRVPAPHSPVLVETLWIREGPGAWVRGGTEPAMGGGGGTEPATAVRAAAGLRCQHRCCGPTTQARRSASRRVGRSWASPQRQPPHTLPKGRHRCARAPPLRLLVAEGQTEPEWPTAARGRRQPEASHGGRLHRKPCLCRAAGLGCPPGVGTVARPRSWLLPDLTPPGQVPSPAPQPVSPLDSGVQMQSGRWVARCSHAALHHEESILTAHWFPGA